MVHEMAKRLNGNDARQANLVAASANDVADDTLVESEVDPEFPSDSNFPMVGIVASAGGLDALKHFFAAMPSTSGMAFVLVPHLDAKHKSLMVELLARQTTMPVAEAIEGMRVEINSVYIIPPSHCLRLSDGCLRLSQLPDPIGAQTAIDFFLRSLAVDQQEQAIGIVLSGTGSHGTLGIREIKRCGGMVMAQSPESAEFDQMPRSAIETGLVDFVLPPNAMPDALLTYSKQPYLNRDHPIATSVDFDEQLKIVLEVMRSQTKYDFRSYRTNMIRRRILRRMGLAHLDDLSKYIEFLQSNPDEVDALSKDFLIGVTAFFREHEAFAFLEKELFPIVVAKQRHETPLRIWVPSCATGEEAYSIAILLLEAFAEAGKPANVQIFASDLNQQSIDIARRGVYLASIAVDVSPERLKHFFVTSDAIHYQVTKQVRDLIVYSTQNIICDAPFSKLDLISCRNLLIYLEPEIQQKLISLFHFALVENGHLLLGPAETVGRATNLFEPVSKKWRVYRRIGPGRRGNISLPVDKLDELQRTKPLEAVPPPPSRRYKELTESTLREYSPAAVLINRRYEVLYVTGSVVDYLEFPAGELSKDLLAMARAGLRTRLRAACHKAITERITVVDKEARVQRKETYIACTITARPLADSNGSEGLVLVMLQDHPLGQATSASATANNPSVATNDGEIDQLKLVQLLEYELKSTREELQSTIEEMESANEELQSSNEELESSKEELQSLNEELSTVNCQLLEKVNELDKSNSEITNLMASTEIPTLYLDAQLRIKRFTDPTVALFSLVPTDEGRDIRDFASQIVDNKLLEDCQQVLQNLEIVETNILTKDKRCFLRRISPFRTSEDRTDGIVVTFIDLTARNLAEAEQRERDACSREIFEHAATGIAIASFAGGFTRCNPAFCELVGYSEEELRSTQFMEIIHPEDRVQNSDAFRSLQSGAVSSFEMESRYLHKNRSVVLVREFVSALPDSADTKANFMALVTDVSVQRKSLDALRQSEERIRTILRTASDAIITIDNRGLIDSVNEATEFLFGYSNAELVGRNVSMLMPQPFSREHDGYIQKFLATAEPQIIGKGREVVCLRKDGSTFPADLAVNQVDHLGHFTGILRDLSSRKEMQKHILDIAADEQRRIGLELHDGTQQELTGLSLFANALQDTIRSASQVEKNKNMAWQFEVDNFDRLKTIADLLSKRIAETNQHVRDLAHGIMPVQIDAEGLQSALIELANSVSSGENCSCVFECEGDVSITNNTTATHLFRIAQEAINNAVRHGLANNIRIFLLLRDDRICLEVSDNGSGFENEAQIHDGSSSQGMGMRTMQYRASLIGGRVHIEQQVDRGTLVRCEILKGGGNL